MKLLAAFLLGMVAAVSIQGKAETWVVLSGYAFHLDRGIYCNDTTWGAALEWGEKDKKSTAGAYLNSHCRWSAYAAKTWLPVFLESLNVRLGATAGLVAGGYKSPLLPAGGLAATYEKKDWGASVVFIPPMSESSPGVAWFLWKLKWK